MNTATTRPPKLPPAWFMHAFWRVHRALYRLSGGRFLWTPASKRGWGGGGPRNHRLEVREGTHRHRRLHRRRAQPHYLGNERLGRRPPRMVAQPRGSPGRACPTGAPAAPSCARASRQRRGTRPTVAALEGDRRRSRLLCPTTLDRDSRGRPRTPRKIRLSARTTRRPDGPIARRPARHLSLLQPWCRCPRTPGRQHHSRDHRRELRRLTQTEA